MTGTGCSTSCAAPEGARYDGAPVFPRLPPWASMYRRCAAEIGGAAHAATSRSPVAAARPRFRGPADATAPRDTARRATHASPPRQRWVKAFSRPSAPSGATHRRGSCAVPEGARYAGDPVLPRLPPWASMCRRCAAGTVRRRGCNNSEGPAAAPRQGRLTVPVLKHEVRAVLHSDRVATNIDTQARVPKDLGHAAFRGPFCEFASNPS